ncbi:MAG: DUF885 family protein, partial [Acidimicrobiales bacterium]
MAARTTHHSDANVGELAERYLAVCYPVDPMQIDLGSYSAVAEALTADGMEHAADTRRDVLRALSDGAFSDEDAVAREQLFEWVSANHDLAESGEKYYPLSQIAAPHARILRAVRASMATDPVDWSAVCDGYEAAASCFREELGLLKRGIDLGFVATQREARFALQRYLGLLGRAGYWLDATLSFDGGISLMQEAQIRSVLEDAARSVDELVGFLEQRYLSRALDQQGIGRDRFSLWSRKVLGEDIDLDELYDSMWAELRDTLYQLDVVAAQMTSGGSVRDLVWKLEADLSYEIDVAVDLQPWIRSKVQAEAVAVDAELVRLPDGATEFVLSGFGEHQFEMLEVHAPTRDGRPGIVLVRALNNMKLSIWSFPALLHLQVIPGEHLFNCFLVDSQTPLQHFQRVLVNPAALSGWSSYSAMMAAFEIDRADEVFHLNALRTRVRELVCALADIGFNLGLKLPDT